jgi:Cu/Ag efflux protein CusF
MRVALVALLLVLSSAAFGQATHKATGVVTRVDAERSRVTIKHGPVASLNWPGMTMGFRVKDKPTLDRISKDRRIDFEFVQQGSDYVVTSVK